MADQPQPGTISAAFPAPPPFYKSFTAQNLDRLQSHLDSSAQPTTTTTTTSPAPTAAGPTTQDLLSLPPELRNLIPPPPPAAAAAAAAQESQYRSFGALHQVGSSSKTTPVAEDQQQQQQQTPTPARLLSLTHKLLLTFLSLTNALATNPAGYGPIWDELHECFQEINKVINGYRPHQARETLILMLEEQLERVGGETKGIGEAVERARGVVEELSKEGAGGVGDDRKGGSGRRRVEGRKVRREREDKRVWEVLEREVGGI